MKYSYIKDAQYDVAGNIDCVVCFDGIGELPFYSDPTQIENETDQCIYDELRTGVWGEVRPALYAHKESRLCELKKEAEAVLATLGSAYPATEVASFSHQETEARKYLANQYAYVPQLDAIASSRGIAVAELAQKIVDKADVFAVRSGRLIGLRQKYEKQIENAQSTKELDEIVFDFTLGVSE